MRVTVLGSGSAGNATLVEADGAAVLVDAGFSGRDIARRLEGVDVDPAGLDGIVITHEHTDHTRGMGVLARRFGLPVYLTETTRDACAKLLRGTEELRRYDVASPFEIGPLRFEPFLTAHDAADPVAVTVVDTGRGHRLGLATDLGRPTAAIRHALAGCHVLVLESNHDEAMLWSGPYPWPVKQRIASSHGHLSNRAAAAFAKELYHDELVAVVLAHLSEHCNEPELARTVVGRALTECGFSGALLVASQDAPVAPIDIAELRVRAGPGQLSLF
ncbi:MAG: MBL fold metallo-hydrolase [Gemmatimonadota bacterium]